MLYEVIKCLNRSMDPCHHSNESYWTVVSCGAVYLAVQGDSQSKCESVNKNLHLFYCGHWNESYWAALSYCFIVLHKVVLTFKSVDEILTECDNSNESYWTVLSCGSVYYAVQGGSNFWVCGWNPQGWPFKRKLLSSTFMYNCFLRILSGHIFFCPRLARVERGGHFRTW